MKISAKVLAAINSIIDGKQIKGIRLNNSVSEKDVEATLEEMRKLEILDINNRFTVAGEILLLMIKEYKEAERILCINSIRVGVVTTEKCVIMAPVYNIESRLEEVEVLYKSKQQIMEIILEKYHPLKNGCKRFRINPYESISSEQMSLIVNEFPLEKTLFYSVISEETKSYVCLIEDNEDSIRIDIERCVKEKVEPGSIRREIALIMGVE